MLNFKENKTGLIPLVLSIFLMAVASGCSSVKLGEIDETMDHRDDMPGPGILSDTKGESKLMWKSTNRDSSRQAPVKMDEINEFELYKNWKLLKSQGKDSAEYQNFLQWLEFQKFKAPQ